MNKTLYLRDEDGPIWDRARELAGDKLSPVVVEALKKFVAEKEAEGVKMERIVVTYRDADNNWTPKAKAFYGRWVIPPDEKAHAVLVGLGDTLGACQRYFAVAVTAKGSVVIYWWVTRISSGAEVRNNEYLEVFSSFEAAIESSYVSEAGRIGLERNGVPVEELDI